MRCAFFLFAIGAAGCTAILDPYGRHTFDEQDAGTDAGLDGGIDAGVRIDAGLDSGPVQCELLSMPANGFVDRTSGALTDVATYGCDSGYYLLGNGGSLTRTCQAGGTWSGSVPT